MTLSQSLQKSASKPAPAGRYRTSLKNLRAQMQKEGITLFLVPRCDIHRGEYVAPCDERLLWLSGFSGSAGLAVIGIDYAYLFVDGRYQLQARQQVDTDIFTIIDKPPTALLSWLQNFPGEHIIGFDPALHTVDEIARLTKIASAESPAEGAAHTKRSLTLKAVRNPIDSLWETRPAPPAAPLDDYPLRYSGIARQEKIKEIAGSLAADCLILTQPDAIAWLLNFRSSDIARVPVALAFAILFADGQVEIFAHGRPDAALSSAPNLAFYPKADFFKRLKSLPKTVQIDPKTAPFILQSQLGKSRLKYADDPCALPKACKNEREIAGARAAHDADGLAMVKFLYWLDRQQEFSELDIVEKLQSLRADSPDFRDISFDTIAGLGPNGAVIHYRATKESNRKARKRDILLLDSGGQYLSGTTDITRTIAIGAPSKRQKHFFTLVLKGMIAVSMARWPRGESGRGLDSLARQFLRAEGYDYAHGTGHGVGAYLSVHEGPQSLSGQNTIPLMPGMIISNEPGYYEEGNFGIRIENLLLVRTDALAQTDAEKQGEKNGEWLFFETLTLTPIDRRLIDKSLLSAPEKNWLNAYHARIYTQLSPRIEDSAIRQWLFDATKPI